MKGLDSYLTICAKYNTDENRPFHIAMCYAGWIPIVGTVGIRDWKNQSGQTAMSYEAAQEFFNRHGCVPVPF